MEIIKINSLPHCIIQNSEIKAFLSNFEMFLQEYSNLLEIQKETKICNMFLFEKQFDDWYKILENISSDENTSQRNLKKILKFNDVTLFPFLKIRKNYATIS